MHGGQRSGTKRCLWAYARLVLVPLAMLELRGAYASAAQPPEPATDRILIKLRDSTAPRVAMTSDAAARDRIDALAVRRATPMRYVRTLYNGAHTVRLNHWTQGAELTALVARLATDPDVEMVSPDRLKHAARTVPNDPRYGANNGDPAAAFTQQWYLMTPTTTLVSAIDAERAWDLSRGAASVPVGIVDTGVLFRHPDLGTVANGGKLLPGYDMVGADNAATSPPFTFYVANDGNGRDADPTDPGDWINTADLTSPATKAIFTGTGVNCPVSPSSWHGTLVSGVIGAATNDGIGIAGVGWDTRVVPVRALGKCAGYDSDILDGMAWAAGLPIQFPDPTAQSAPANPNPVKIINLSLGSPTTCSSFYSSLISQLSAMNVVVVAAAGNSSGSNGAGGAVTEPANCPGVIAVAALRNTGTKVAFSNFGAEVAISAPGGNCVNLQPPCLYSIVSTINTGTESASDSEMAYVDGNQPQVAYSGHTFAGGGVFGTSFSAPMVSGVIALMWAANPGLTATQVASMLKTSARPFPPAGTVPVCPASDPTTGECSCTQSTCGAGMLDAYGAVMSALGNPANPTPLPAPSASSPPVIPAAMAQSTPPAPSSSGGGGGAEAPWWILGLLAAGVIRASAEKGRRGEGGRHMNRYRASAIPLGQ
jgi:serine protease